MKDTVPLSDLLSYTSFVQHGFNTIFILVEFALLAIPICWGNLDIVLATSIVYLLVSIPRFGTLPSIPVDLRTNLAALSLLLLLIVHVAAHRVFCWLSRGVPNRNGSPVASRKYSGLL